ncbi:CaiB/BaiF CoA-transferase family protein [Microbacterium sp. NC79]|uniref:CaiB/BaiF CoA transferase family protein n=1 Tax=Microbacterium sp. NC79 TaxID=2851009 RepID=UPI001C2CC0D2|nr:CaiB/BaiF CoA-transferase family protein [Microbacterium sp. NC79]MBV0896143.1 CoA transferase [Microbacterium sp. NC79]
MDSNVGPLAGTQVVELGGIGPAPFTGMILQQLGATVTVVARPGKVLHPTLDRGKTVFNADLKSSADTARVRELVAGADVVIEGFRPGVAERLGFGPDHIASLNRAAVVGRITGFGRSGPLADRAGHDINYIALSGALGAIGPADSAPTVPLNLVADFGGGGLMLALGVTAAILRVARTGIGEVVDTAMVDGAATLTSMIYGFVANGRWDSERGDNILDGGSPYYRTYECADGKFIAVGAIEPQFYAELVRVLGLSGQLSVSAQTDRSTWALQAELFGKAFATASRDEWEERFAGVDACVTPVLSLAEAPTHPHNAARGTFSEIPGGFQPLAANRFTALPVLTSTT